MAAQTVVIDLRNPSSFDPLTTEEFAGVLPDIALVDKIHLYKTAVTGNNPWQRTMKEIIFKTELPLAVQKYKIPGMKQKFLETLREDLRQLQKKIVYIEGPNPEQLDPSNPVNSNPILTAIGCIFSEMSSVRQKELALFNMEFELGFLCKALEPLLKVFPNQKIVFYQVVFRNGNCCKAVVSQEITFNEKDPRNRLYAMFESL